MSLPEILAEHPRLCLAVYASLFPLFAPFLGPEIMVEPFALQFAGPPSCGKTRAIQLARAVWFSGICTKGCYPPDGSTWVWDNCSHMNADRLRVELAHWFQGRARGVLILDGAIPDPLLAEDTDHPAIGRLITLWGSPFGQVGIKGALASDALALLIEGMGGTLGPFMTELIKRAPDEAKKRWRDLYLETRTAYQKKAAVYGSIQARLSTHLAGLAVTAQLCQALRPDFFTWDWGPSIKDAWTWLCLSRDRTNGATYALEYVRDYLSRNSHRVAHVASPGSVPPVAGFAAVQDTEAGVIYVTRKWLEETFTEEGMDLPAIVKEWQETGASLRPGSGRQSSWTVNIPGQGKVRCIALPLDSITPHARA